MRGSVVKGTPSSGMVPVEGGTPGCGSSTWGEAQRAHRSGVLATGEKDNRDKIRNTPEAASHLVHAYRVI